MKKLRKVLAIILTAVFAFSGATVNVEAAGDGWRQENGIWYFYCGDAKLTGWINDGGTWYYTNADGVLQTGWVEDKGVWYFFSESGAMCTGWVCAGDWYYMDESGAMATGWRNIDGYWYYFNSNGTMATGWVDDNGTWYYMSTSGDMYKGWLLSGDWYYYCDRSSGAMQSNTTVNCISLGASGAAENTAYANEKIPVMIKAKEVVDSICNPNDSLAYKQQKCYEWVAKWPYLLKDYPIGSYYNGRWSCYSAHYAANILLSDQPGAECAGEAAALGYLFNELNFGTVYFDHSEVHGWIEVNGRFWDPLNQEAHKGGKNWLNIAPSEYEMSSGYHWTEI